MARPVRLSDRDHLCRRSDVDAPATPTVTADRRRPRPPSDRRGPTRRTLARARRSPARPDGRACRAPLSPSGRRTHRPCASSATSTDGTARAIRCVRWAARESGSCSSPGLGAGSAYKFEILTRDGRWIIKADPMARSGRGPARDRVRRDEGSTPLAGRRMDGRDALARHPVDQPMSVYEIHLGSWRPRPDLPHRGRRDHRTCHVPRLHACRVPAPGRAPVRRILGISGHRVLRADQQVRNARRSPVPDRSATPGRHRRDHGLGSGPLPEGRVRPGPVRRATAVRAPRPPPRRAQGLGHVHLRLRASRGPQLPGRERPLLVRRVPRRRTPRRRGRLDALPRLLTQRG